jgi:V-type H+-transporting ATPase subunit G
VCSVASITLLLIPHQHAGNTQTAQAAVDKETEAKRGEIAEQYKNNKDAVVKKLLDRVILAQPELHRNLKKQE